MTAAGIHRSPQGTAPDPGLRPPRPALAWLRLAWLYLVSRRVHVALTAVAGLGAVLWAALHWHWSVAGGPAAQQVVPLVIETGTAAVIALTTYGPFGEPERASGRSLPYLRLGTAVGLTAAAAGLLAAGATAGYLPGGTVAMLRNLAGLTGIGLLSAAALGGALAWAGPMAYLLVAEGALAGGWTTPWAWPARAPHDAGGALCAALVAAAGIAVITVRGARESVGD
jgi:hypothetical protein